MLEWIEGRAFLTLNHLAKLSNTTLCTEVGVPTTHPLPQPNMNAVAEMTDPKTIEYVQPAVTTPEEEKRYVTKRDGTRELLMPIKLVKWNNWMESLIGKGLVPWTRGVKEVLDEAYDGISTNELQDGLIRFFLRLGTWSGNRAAGILWAPTLHKKMYGEKIPTVKQMHDKMVRKGLMRPLPYSLAEYEEVESIINHDNDFNYAHFQIKHVTQKYSLVNHSNKTRFETPQFIYMRMAMALCEDVKPAALRMQYIRDMYEMLHKNIVNAPTPNYIYLGSPMNGLVSCCVITNEDSIPSLSVANAIAYRMTAIGAGIGIFLRSRNFGENVRNGAILHNGKLPYWRSIAGDVKANMQSGRAGACTGYYNIFDAEANAIAQLQNPRTPPNRRNRDMHFAVQYNRLFLRKALQNEQVFTFSCKTAPDLFQAFYSGDRQHFEDLYNKYEADPTFIKTYVDAGDLLVAVSRQGPEVGTHYEFHADNANKHTPFKETIYSSNLCVAPETLVTTDKGDFPIKDLDGQKVNVWNGIEFAPVEVVKTGVDQALRTVYLDDGKTTLSCTPYHKWYVVIDGKVVEKRTHELTIGMKLEPYIDPRTNTTVQRSVTLVIDTKRIDDTYCFTEPKRNRGMFNGVVTGQCLEIMEVTHAYEELNQLFANTYLGKITFLDDEGQKHTYFQSDDFFFADQPEKAIPGGELQEGMCVLPMQSDRPIYIKEILQRDQQPETALCSLAGIVASNIVDDAQYEKAMWCAQHMIDYCIHKSDYPFPQIAFTAKKRLNAGIGLLGVATVMARAGVTYDSKEGYALLSKIAERHMFFAIKCSIKMGKERGNAPWMFKTKWPEGWLPIDTYDRSVDEITPHVTHYDWEWLRAELIANKGMRFSCLVAHMPTESSSKAAGCPNGIYPIRGLSMGKSDATNFIDWVATDSDTLGSKYQIAWEVSPFHMLDGYAVVQKWTDQGISSDIYLDRSIDPNLKASFLKKKPAYANLRGLKSGYYTNSKTDNDGLAALTGGGAVCGSGGCVL